MPLHDAFQDLGLSNWWLPERFGGIGVGMEESVDLVSELAYGDAGFAFTTFISIRGTTMLSLYGSEEVTERYLVPMAKNGSTCATVASERAAGSELTKIATTAARRGEDRLADREPRIGDVRRSRLHERDGHRQARP